MSAIERGRPTSVILTIKVRHTTELRWNGLSSEPTQTLRVHLSRDLVSRTAEEMGDHDPARLVLVERIGFQYPLLTQIGLAPRWELEQSAPAGKLYA